ncbi:MAG: carbonic anhydrase family protein, partial [Burkholderiales bacterium]|nr:carbonic anhydrase family protein [Burkholderiales bacterium]
MPTETRTITAHTRRRDETDRRNRAGPARWLARWARCAAVALPLVAHAAPPPHWQYSGPYGPAQWAEMRKDYALCARGRRQSPIDIVATR